jgi:RNA polymerase sigma-70 factor (ECF subfamily)
LQAADAADVGQEVFQTVARKVGDFHRDRPGDSFRGWLWTITRNKVHDFHRARLPDQAAGDPDALERLTAAQPADEDGRPEAEAKLLYRQALDLLRQEFQEATWRAFWRVVVDGQRPAAVAAELGLTANAVYLAKSRVLRRVRQEYADLLDPGSV